MLTPIRWGIIGTGKIAHAFASALRDTPDAVLAAVGSRQQASAAAFCAEFGGTPYASYAALCAAPEVDVVYVATPHSLHAENALQAIAAGKHVLVEKPFTINQREAVQVVAAARARGVFAMEAMWTRFLPASETVRALIAAGEIGTPRQISADFGFPSTLPPEHRLHNRALGGGALLDIGIYPLALASEILGPVESVQGQSRLAANGSDVMSGFILRHTGGGMAACICSTEAWSPIELTIAGPEGYLRLPTPFYKARQVHVVKRDGSQRTIDTPYRGNGYVHQAEEVMRCLRAGALESPRMPLDESVALMGVLDTLRAQVGLRYEADA
ncbi:Gfo/Idh/MocA family protein [Massilia sp. TS11]|uniref:Gfo/Idh/MocA family protein n=1 Tax=Massilia sp. TS11 TaxID=2908003 RepID=UPI001EDB9202|nr:Gfo/Idh/MocA family oxidoreductase [Massilia sp. TS11]MCG2586893.1 Gfo/Idh/MocA family oxidoreductase [Massilia sp. TS11]